MENKQLQEEAEEYAKSISKNDTYQEYLVKAYIKGASKSAEITQQIAIEFAKYIDSSSFYYSEKEIWKSTVTEDVKTSNELFEEFLKQYNGTIK